MKLRNVELRNALAAQYVLGTLRGAARTRFARLAARDSELSAELRFWESRLDRLARGVQPVTPPETVWIGLERRIEQGNTVPLRSSPARAPRTVASGWRIVAGLATAAAVVVAVLLMQPKNGPESPPPTVATAAPSAPPVVPSAPSEAPAPTTEAAAPATPTASYVALLKMAKGDMQWTVSLAPARGHMTVAASGSAPQLQGHSPELWWLSPNGPVALGVLPVRGDGSMDLPAELANAAELKLAISIEPVGGSPTGKPTGPVVAVAVAVKTA